jgi:hypothetical protein
MIARCKYPSASSWRYYGKRGITVCERWLVFENFLADMGECPGFFELDRINPFGNYEPENCRWVSHSDNMKNLRSNHTK